MSSSASLRLIALLVGVCGAAATLLMSRAAAKRLNLPILGTLRSFAVAGVPPEIMVRARLIVAL